MARVRVSLACAALALIAAQPPRGNPSSIEVDPALRVELVAAEPLVFDPVDLEFDERGRAFVLEMPGYPIVEPDEPAPGRVVVLHDDDGDARFDRRTLFAEGFRYANSILPYRGGLLISDAPDLLFVRDADGDGRAEVRQVLLTGFGTGPSESSFNGLRFGPDNWVHGAIGANGGNPYFPDRPEERRSLRGRDFAVRFEESPADRLRRGAGEVRETGASGDGFGLDFDVWGRRFVVDEQKHIQAEIFPDTYLPAGHAWPSTVVEISDHGRDDAARVYPISEVEARPNHPEQAGYFTAGCGITHYGGGAFPPGFEGSFFVAEAVHNLVHRDVVEPDGAGFVARRDREHAEVLAARDNAFRPVNFAVGPDGALYLLDMHRAVIEHPEWIPDEIERAIDVRAGADQGRIYRIVPRDGLPAATIDEEELGSPRALARWLRFPNQWWRDTARRLFVERGARWAEPALPDLVLLASDPSAEPLARVAALRTLDGLGELRTAEIVAALESEPWGLRENALRLAEAHILRSPGARLDGALLAQLVAAATDPGPRVRMQAMLTLGALWERLPEPARALALESAAVALHRDAGDPWIRVAATALAARSPLGPLRTFTTLLGAGPLHPQRAAALEGFAAVIGERADAAELDAALALAKEFAHRAPLLQGLAAGLARAPDLGRDLPAIDELDPGALAELRSGPDAAALPAWRISRLLGWRPAPADLDRARQGAARAADPSQSVAARLDALRWLDVMGEELAVGGVELLLDRLDASEPPELQRTALEQVIRSQDPAVGRALLARWRSLGPAVRQRAADFLIYRAFNHDALLDALESGELPIGQLNMHLERRRALLRARDAETRRRAAALFSDLEVTTRAGAIDAMRPALALEGAPERGREIFVELCARCHRILDVPASGVDPAVIGSDIGPSLTDIFRRSQESLLVDVVDPNAAVDPSYLVFDVETSDGEIVSGLLVAQDERGVTVRTADGVDHRIARERVREITASGLSLMPEELEAGLDHRAMADLLAFLSRPR